MRAAPTKVPGIPKVPTSVAPDVRQYLEMLSEAVEIRLGRRGDPVDRALTLRELIDSGLAKQLRANPFDPNNPNSGNIGIGPLIPAVSPYAPLGFTVEAAYSQVNMFWEPPFYVGHSQTEIWSATEDVLGDATLTGVSTGFGFIDPIGSGASRYYWVRFINVNGIPGPYNAAAGTPGVTAPDVDHLLGVLNNSITSGQLAQDLLGPINSIPGLTNDIAGINTEIASVQTDIAADLAGINGDIAGIQTAVAANVLSIADMVSTGALDTALASYTTTASLQSNYYTLAEADTAIAAAITTFNTDTIAADYTNTADLVASYYTKTTADGAIAAAITAYNTNTIGPTYTNTATLNQNFYTKTTADTAIATAINTYNTQTIAADYTNTADLVASYYTKTTADTAIAAAINTYNTNTVGANYTTTATLNTNFYTKTTADTAIAAAINTYNTQTIAADYTNTATLNTNFYTKTDADGAFAATEDILEAEVDNPNGTGTVTLAQAATAQANVNGDLYGQYTVKLDINGAISGFGLSSTTSQSGVNTSAFIVNADRFALMRGGSNGAAAVTPFVVQTTPTTIGGTVVPAGIYMDTAFIKHASIAAAQIGSVNADTITTGTLNVTALLSANSVDVTKLNLVGVGAAINLASAATGARMVIQGSNIAVYDSSGALRVKLGAL